YRVLGAASVSGRTCGPGRCIGSCPCGGGRTRWGAARAGSRRRGCVAASAQRQKDAERRQLRDAHAQDWGSLRRREEPERLRLGGGVVAGPAVVDAGRGIPSGEHRVAPCDHVVARLTTATGTLPS